MKTKKKETNSVEKNGILKKKKVKTELYINVKQSKKNKHKNKWKSRK